jgi:hypothetical protein
VAYKKFLLILVAVMIGVSMTALTATVTVDETRINNRVTVDHSPLILDVLETSSDNGTIDTSILTTARGVDRLDVNLPDALVKDDTFELRPVVTNGADGPLFVRLSTNTSAAVKITGFSSADVNPVKVTPIGGGPTVIEFELAQGQTAATITVEYVVISDGAGGQFDVDMFLDIVE